MFGPVLAVVTFATEEKAVSMANSTRHELGAGGWTSDVRRDRRIADRLRAGDVRVSAYRMVAPNVPFGGSGHSGWGDESGMAVRAGSTASQRGFRATVNFHQPCPVATSLTGQYYRSPRRLPRTSSKWSRIR